ncbi:leader peptidase (prepilin peptidase) / N-methyltransferase [Rhizobiales bacterium GAS113]|nr:leader peptidase (prepilin peptidase) / N-methyltransferase [Rhizobiales bacterium GAS113]SED13327.1 leader peptidase (prepilin peptidase) / N-methyltransferase [Rhizobiales bacterium GAS188]
MALLACAGVLASIAAAPGLPGLLGGVLALLMIAIAAVDARHFIIPDALSAPAFLLALAAAWIRCRDGTGYGSSICSGSILADLATTVLRGAVLALAFLALRELYRWLRGREGLGLGDVKLAGVAGAWLGWATIPISIEIAALVALAVHIIWRRSSGLPLRATTRLPFGLFFAPAIWLCWFLEAVLTRSQGPWSDFIG